MRYIQFTKSIDFSIQERNWQNVLLIDNEKVNDNLLRASLNLKDIDYLPRTVSILIMTNDWANGYAGH